MAVSKPTSVVYSSMTLDELKEVKFKADIVWKNAIGFLIMHIMGVYGLYLAFSSAQFYTTLWGVAVSLHCGVGITVGAHRLYTHRSYKANTIMQFILMVFQTMSGQNCCYIWARDHRQHHKYSDTVADPHDSTRGFFFCHIGWLMVRKHPAVIAAGKIMDMSDLEANPLIMFQKKYYKSLYVLLAICVPVCVPWYCWGETFTNSFMVAYMMRYILQLNITWCVNSAAHLWGKQPYNKNLAPRENVWVTFFAQGEGWHNYHHTFPWDYKCGEHGMKFNSNARIIEMCAKYGWATELRSASKDTVMKKVQQCGDGSHHLWGYGDKDMSVEERQMIDESTEFGDGNTQVWGYGDEAMREEIRQHIDDCVEKKDNMAEENLVKRTTNKRKARSA